ncbi:hypothetical protein FALBO_5170 [Fusarium albosuccineum]|uniref:DUF7924 domain-containing protein n=1 Tax=Fusarium albosuccineum TaxID=1237068 RepID=A0A8H4LF97_9HYPO|nr:hypothetical protein FALBO_5170 [Fusarium albosuccineum]
MNPTRPSADPNMEPQTQISDGIPDDEISDHYRGQEILRNNGMIYLAPYRAFKEVPSDVESLAKDMAFWDNYLDLAEWPSSALLRQQSHLPPRQFGQSKIRRLKYLSQGGVNNDGLLYPFLTVAIEGNDSVKNGSLWAATDTCLASSSVCVTLVQKIEQELKVYDTSYYLAIDNTAFSVAMNGTVARLYVTFVTENGSCAMYNARSFLLQNPDHHLAFRIVMLNILEWGQSRLSTIAGRLRMMLPEA